MPTRRQFAPLEIEAADVVSGRIEANYLRVLKRLLAAHAMAEKLTADGYERALATVANPALKPTLEKNLAEERRHAALVYEILAALGMNQLQAERLLIPVLKAPSFEAPRRFADSAAGELDLVMASLSLDLTGLIMVGVNYRESSYAPHARAAEIIMAEEQDHEIFAAGELATAVERFGAVEVNAALRVWLPLAVNFFGPPGSGFTYDCIRYGLKTRDNNELAELYVTMLERRVLHAGLEMPELTPVYPHAIAQ